MIEENKFYWRLLDALKDGVYFVNKKRQVTYWNEAAEKITGFTKADVLGKFCGDNILVHIDAKGNNLCQGACPLSWALESGQPCEASIYLHHKGGHRIPVFVQINPITDAKGEVIGAVEIFSDTSARGHFLERMEALKDRGLLDPISGIPNQSFLERKIGTGLWELQQYGWPFGIITIRIDCIEGLKDNGKDCYSEAVRLFAQTLIHNITSFDWVGRWTGSVGEGDKVCYLAIIHNTNEAKLGELADVYRTLIQKTDLAAIDREAKITVSTGTAMARVNDSPELLLQRAKETE